MKNQSLPTPHGLGLPSEPMLSAEVRACDFITYNSQIMGEVLTLIDSAIPESAQQKALKSLIKQSFWRTYDHVWHWMSDKKHEEDKGMSSTHSFPFGVMDSVE